MNMGICLSQNWDRCSEDGHVYAPSVGVTMVVEGPSVVDGHGGVRHKMKAELLAMSVHQKFAVVDHVYVQLAKIWLSHYATIWERLAGPPEYNPVDHV